MNNNGRLPDLLARLLSYPAADYPHAARACGLALREQDPEHSAAFDRFSDYVEATPLEEMEELFTRSFDLNPVCCLEVGWQLYGEDYNRGRFMVSMRQQLRTHNVPESIELPDHLANLLPLVGRMAAEEAGPLCASSILPALRKMLSGLEGLDNPYEEVLLAVRRLIEPLAAPYPQPAIPLTQIQQKEEVTHG